MRDLLNEADTGKMAILMKHLSDKLEYEPSGPVIPRNSYLRAGEDMTASLMEFEAWTSNLRENCSREGKLAQFDCLSEYVLRLFWERGVEPTPEALSEDGSSGPVMT
jgi:hypothetical protein